MAYRNLLLAIMTLTVCSDTFAELNFNEFLGVSDNLYLSKADYVSGSSLNRRKRSRRVSYYFDSHFDYSENGYISVPPNADVASSPRFPRRALEKKYTYGHKESFSAGVKLALFGSEVTAGPKLTFSREYSVVTKIVATSMRSLLLGNGKLDHSKRLWVSCKVNGAASHATDVAAGLKLFGVGAETTASNSHQVSISLESTPFFIPQENNVGQETSYGNVTDWCEKVFFRLNKESIDDELKMAASELVYKFDNNQCVNDLDCESWAGKQTSSSYANYYSRQGISVRCVSKDDEKYPYGVCVLKKSEGQTCSSRAKNWQMNSCDSGLKCVVTRPKTYYSSEVTSCQ